MPGATIIAVNAANTANAAAASRAHQAQITACHAMMPDYRDAQATIEQRRIYADCVELLHPRELTAETVFLIKALIIAALIGTIVGVIREVQSGYSQLSDAVFGGVVGLFVGPMIIGCIAALWYGTQFLFA